MKLKKSLEIDIGKREVLVGLAVGCIITLALIKTIPKL